MPNRKNRYQKKYRWFPTPVRTRLTGMSGPNPQYSFGKLIPRPPSHYWQQECKQSRNTGGISSMNTQGNNFITPPKKRQLLQQRHAKFWNFGPNEGSLRTHNVTSSQLACSSVGRALHWHRRGHGFESRSGMNFFRF